MLGRTLPDFAPVPRPAQGPEYRPTAPPLLPGQPKRRTRGPNRVKKVPREIVAAFPWSNPEEDFLTRLLIKIEALIQIEGEVITWRKDIHENFPAYQPVPVPGAPVPQLYLKDAGGTLHKFSPLEIRFAYFTRRFPHDVRLLDVGQRVLSRGAQARYLQMLQDADLSDTGKGGLPQGRSLLKDYSLGNLTQSSYPTIKHRTPVSSGEKDRRGFLKYKHLDPLAWRYHDRYRPCYVDLVEYRDPISVVRICPHNFWQYKGDTECEVEWQKLDADIRGDLLRTNLRPGMFIRISSRNLGAMSSNGRMNFNILPTLYGERELRGPEDSTYDEGWLRIKGGRPRRVPHNDGRRLKGRKHEDLPDRPAHNPSPQNFTPIPRPASKLPGEHVHTPEFADQLWRTLEEESFYPPRYQPDPALAPRFYATDLLKLGIHPWQAEKIRLYELELAKELRDG